MSKKSLLNDQPQAERKSARLFAVQALFQLDFNPKAKAQGVVLEFTEGRLQSDLDGATLHAADVAFFKDIVMGASDGREVLDKTVEPLLKKDWSLSRLNPVLRAVFRAAGYELAARPDIPTAVVINEYLDVTKAFLDKSEASFANGILDNLAKQLRPEA